MGDEGGINHQPDRDLASIAEHAHAHADVTRGWRPDEHGAHRYAGEVYGLGWARNVSHNGRALSGEQVDDPSLERFGGQPGRAQQPVGHRPLARSLDLAHALVDLDQAAQASAHPDRERQEYQAEFVPEFAWDGLVERAQVEGN